MIKRLIIFDFDKTLMQTSEPEEGKLIWGKHYSKPFKWIGWWGRPESLDLNVFDIKPFPKLLEILNKGVGNSETYVVILTNRIEKLRPEVQTVLDINNIRVDKLDMKSTEETKGERLFKYIRQFPDLVEINAYEDRQSDIESYENIKPQIPKNIRFNIYLALNGQITLLKENNLVNIIKEEIQNFVGETLKSPLNIYHGADINNLKNFMANPKILSPEEKIKLPSNTGGYNVGLSTSTDIDKAKKYSKYGFGHNKVLHLQLIPGAKIIQIDTNGDSIDDIFTGDDLENYQKQGIDAIIELDDSAENEARILNSQHLKIIEII